MRMVPECVPCLLRRVLFETRLVDEKLAHRTIRESSRILGREFKEGVNSAIVATKVHRKAYDIIGVRDPYEKMKRESDRVAHRLFPRAEAFVKNANNDIDRFRAAAIVSIAGNLLDFGISNIESPYALLSNFDKICREGLGWDDTPKVVSVLRNSYNIIYFTDNCGEIVFDRLLLRAIKKLGVKITLVPKLVPILTDATVEDIHRAGLDRIADEVVDAGNFAVGVDLKGMTPELKRRLDSADLIVCKGMGNYESFSDSDYRPIVYLLRAKCDPVANSMGVRKDTSVVKLYK